MNEKDYDYIENPLLAEEVTTVRNHKILITLIFSFISAFSYWSYITILDEVTVAKGRILPYEGVLEIRSPISGRITNVNFEEGDFIKKGEVLLKFDSTELDYKIENAKIRLKTLRQQKALFDKQFSVKDRLTNEGLSSKMEFLSMKIKKIELEGNILDLNQEIQSMTSKINNSILRAGQSGLINRLIVLEGQNVITGDFIGDIVPKTSKLIAEVKIPSNEIGYIRKGQRVALKLDTYDYSKHGFVSSKIHDVSPIATLSQDGSNYFVSRIRLNTMFLDSPDGKKRIVPGMTLSADIKTGNKTVAEYLLKPIFSSATTALREK